MSGPMYPRAVSRTKKQPLAWYCVNPECVKTGNSEFTSDIPKCPRCTCEGPPTIQLRTLIHLLVPDPKGPILGAVQRWKFACDPKREHLALEDNMEAATDNVHAANCPGCLETANKLSIVDALGRRISRQDIQNL